MFGLDPIMLAIIALAVWLAAATTAEIGIVGFIGLAAPLLARLTGIKGWVRDRSAAELSAIRLIDAADGIPTLAEVLRIVDGRVPLLIEI